MIFAEYSKKLKDQASFNDLPREVRKKIIDEREKSLEQTKMILQKYEDRRNSISK